MVYSIRNEKPIVSAVPLKKSRVQGKHSKYIELLMKNNYISVSRDENGKPVVNIIKKDDKISD